jgi:predicted small integral membrane protein
MAEAASIDVTAVTFASPRAGRRFWARAVGYGLILGVSISLLEFAHYRPLVSTPDTLGVASLVSLLLSLCGEGVLLALTIALFERRAHPHLLGPRQLALAVVIGSVAGVLAWQAFLHFILRDWFGIWHFRDHAGQPASLMAAVLYHLWLMILFGGLTAAVYLYWQRQGRMLAALRAAELSREDSQRWLAETRLATLQARIDPEFLFQTLTKLEQLYEADPPGADRLLEELIVFLRAALAGIPISSASNRT